MKRLLLFAGLIFSSLNANAQLTCANATPITANGTLTAPGITGTYGTGCWAPGANPNSIWYSYTATANGEVTVSSDLAVNVGPTYSTDTRVSIFTGTCGTLTCYEGNDDVSGTNFKSTLTFPVQSGTTYYIVWDDRWSALGFQFTFNFVATSCLRPTTLDVNPATNITANSASLTWDAAIGNPSGYDVEHGPVGHVAGTGTIVNTTTTSANLSSLPASTTVEYYLRSNCGGTQSGWVGPFRIYLAKTLPYSNNFDGTDNSDGFTYSGFGLNDTAGAAHSGAIFLLSNTSITAATNSWAFSRALSLAANEQVTFNFQAGFVPTGAATTLRVTVGTAATAAAQTTQLQSFALTGGALAYSPRTATWTAPAAGIYYFALNNVAPVATTAGSLIVDTVAFTSVLGTNEFSTSNLAVYPNPSNGIVNISSDSNALLSDLSITDLNGRVVKSSKLSGESSAQVNISDLSAGVYMMNINSDQGSVTKKIIKN